MRFLCVFSLLLAVLGFCTCTTPSRNWPTPSVASEFRKNRLCLEEIRFFTDDKFSDLAEETSLTRFVKEESRKGLETKLREAGFVVGESSSREEHQLHLSVGAGLRNSFPQFFVVARVQIYDHCRTDQKSRLICEFLVESEIRSDKEQEVRRTGNVLTDKMVKKLKTILGPSN